MSSETVATSSVSQKEASQRLGFFESSRHKGKMRDYYQITDFLGDGAYGEVRKCIYKANMHDRRTTIRQERAVKIINKNWMDETDLANFKNEIECAKQLEHPNILNIHHFFEDKRKFMIITDMCYGGTLQDLIDKKIELSDNDVAIIMKQLLSAMVMMDQEKIMHRDLKPENIILQTKGNISDLKIIDFGTALNYKDKIANGETLKLYDKVGTLLFMAPEVVNADMEKRKWYDEKCDMWSIGIICYILLAGQMPFKVYHE